MRAALGFLTIVGGASRPDPRAAGWFGAVGVLVGLAVGGTWWAANRIWAPLLAAVLAVGVDAALTGMLHLDGLADTADGVLPSVPRERRRAIMAAPDIGAFGVGAVVLVLLTRVGALAGREPAVLLVVGLWAAARAAMPLALAALPYVGGGSGRAFSPVPPVAALVGVGSIALGGALVVVALGAVPGLVTLVGATAGFGGVLALGMRRLGGVSGDVLGAAGVVAETVGLVVAAGGW